MDSARLKFLFQRYIGNTCTDAERKELMTLIDRSENDAALRTLLDDLWQSLPADTKLPIQKTDTILANILPVNERYDNVVPLHGKRSPSVWTKVAAAAAVVMLAGTGVYFLLPHNTQPLVADAATESTTMDHKYVKLPDGSTVILNTGSTLHYEDAFATGSIREVTLTGEAYFDIVHDPIHPFVVRTAGITTTVLGTAFNIKAYEGEEDITVTVTRGKVKVSDREKTLGVITPNQQISFNKTAHASTQRTVDSQTVLAWTANDMFFDDITVTDAIGQLQGRFNVAIALANANIGNCKFTATFMHGEDLDQILQVICEFNRATYTRQPDGSILIIGEGC